MHATPPIGSVGRFFPVHYRPARDEIKFLATHGFGAIQFAGNPQGLSSQNLGDDLTVVRSLLDSTELMPTMEIVLKIDATGTCADGATMSEVFARNLPAIEVLKCNPVHIHIVPEPIAREKIPHVMEICASECQKMAEMAQSHHFVLGVEHNDPDFPLLSTPSACQELLNQVPMLGFVWDTNHTSPATLADYSQLFNRLITVHVSDTPLPNLNYHWALGKGNLDWKMYLKPLKELRFAGPLILEVGGLPKSGGYGQDTDEALLSSKRILEKALLAV